MLEKKTSSNSGSVSRFQTLKEQYATDLKGFISELNNLETSASNAPASEKRDALQNSLSRLTYTDNISRSFIVSRCRHRSCGQGYQTEAARLEAEHKTLESSLSFSKRVILNLKKKLRLQQLTKTSKSLRDEINTLDSLLNRHNSDVRSYQRLSDRPHLKASRNKYGTTST